MRKCSICKQPGHDRRTCPQKLQTPAVSEDQLWQLVEDATQESTHATAAAAELFYDDNFDPRDVVAVVEVPAPPLPQQVEPASLRGSVTDKKALVWEYRRERDAYTLQKAAKVETQTPQVDHILEIQFVDLALARAAKQAAVAPNQDELQQLREVTNCVANLNVTTRAVNQKKKGPFMAWCKRQKDESKLRSLSLTQLSRTAFTSDKDRHTWALICGALASSFDCMTDALQGDLQPASQPVVAAFVEQTATMFDSFGLDA